MSDYIEEGAIKIIEILGVSKKSFDTAIENGISKASKSISGITGFETIKRTGRVKDGKIAEYHVTMKVAFAVK